MYIVKGSLSSGNIGNRLKSAVTNDYHAPREWSDASGSFKVTASFVSLGNGKVKLKKENGAVIEVDMDVLSEADRVFVNKLRRN